MPTETILFKNTGYFSSLIANYLAEETTLKPFYNRFPNLDNFERQIQEKEKTFSNNHRDVLVARLKAQYANLEVSETTLQHINALKKNNTFTITTGHQLNLFTGPLYFLYKIVSAINLAKTLKQQYPNYNFVPVYWMATEDHDFEEINYFNFKGRKIQWNTKASGAVGEINTSGLEAVFDIVSKLLGDTKNANQLKALFKQSYLEHGNLTNATRFLANTLFKNEGLVIIDGNDSALKTLFKPYVSEELLKQVSHTKVTETNTQLKNLGYSIQVNPREINLFYLKENLRERIVFEHEQYKVNNTDIVFSKKEILEELAQYPERFSPNVIMRPLYQEVILPNLCYIGGGGELAYWFQLKNYFKAVSVPFPILLLRNSVLIKSAQQLKKQTRLGLTTVDLFLKRESLINKKIREISNIEIDFSSQITHLKTQFDALYDIAKQTDASFKGAVSAQEKKQIKGLKYLEKRLLKAQKRKLKDKVIRVTELQEELFPNQSLQERYLNFSELYLEYGTQLIDVLVLNLQPLKGEFLILTLD